MNNEQFVHRSSLIATMTRRLAVAALTALALSAVGCSSAQAAQHGVLILLVSGRLRGRATGCDCPGGFSGGLPRRAAAIEELFVGSPPIGLDCGGFLDLDPEMGRFMSRCTLFGLARLGLKVAGVTPRDLFYGPGFISSLADSAGITLLSANLIDAPTGEPLFQRWAVFRAEAQTIAVTSLADYEPGRRYTTSIGWTVVPPDTVLPEVAATRPDTADVVILLTDIGESELRRLLVEFPLFDLVLTSSRHFYTTSPCKIETTLVVQPKPDGRALEWVILSPGAPVADHFRYADLPLAGNRRENLPTLDWLNRCLGRLPVGK